MNHDNDNNRDNNKKDEDGKKVTPFEEFLRRRFPEKKADADPHTPPPPGIPAHDVPTSPQAVMAAARMELAAYFNFVADPNNRGLKILRNNPHHQVLQAVYNNDLGKLFSTMALAHMKSLTRRWYWHFPQDFKDVSFVTPAHLVRTHLLAVAVARHNSDFKAQDSEGRTPLYYVSRHGRDPWLIPFMVSTHNVNPYDSGRCTNDYNLQTAQGEPYAEPLLRTIRYVNAPMLKGFMMIAPHQFDLSKPRDNWGQTPLMLAVQEAHDAVMRRNPDEAAQRARRLWIVRELAGEPSVDIGLKDIAGNTARDYALHPDVRAAFDAGVARRAYNAATPRISRQPKPPGL